MEWIKKLKPIDGLLVLGLVLVIIGLGIGWSGKFEKQTKVELVKSDPPSSKTSSGEVQVDSKVAFDVGGAVVKPGVYSLNGGSRINEALVVAGGLSAEADRDWVEKNINKAEMIRDGMKVYIPKVNEIISNSKFEILNEKVLGKSQTRLPDGQVTNNKQISLNTATLEELDTLSGIGPALGQRIIDYREKNGGFRNIEELKLVLGIGEKLFEKIREKIAL